MPKRALTQSNKKSPQGAYYQNQLIFREKPSGELAPLRKAGCWVSQGPSPSTSHDK